MQPEALVIEHLFGAVGGHGVVRLKGPLTSENVSDFQNAVRREKAPTMILDLTDGIFGTTTPTVAWSQTVRAKP